MSQHSPVRSGQPAAVHVIGEALIDVVRRSGAGAEYVGGSPANVAFGLGRLAHPTTLVSWVGPDDRGRRIADACQASSVVLADGSTAADRTPVAIATIDAGGRAAYDFDLTWDLPALPSVANGIERHLHTGSIAAILEPGGTKVVAAVRDARESASVSYDPNARPTLMGRPEEARPRIEELIGLADVVKASDEDTGWLYPGQPLADVAARWIASGPRLVVITLGPSGAQAWTATGEHLALPATAPTVQDTVGAGDSFMAGLLSGLLDAGLLGSRDAVARLAVAPATEVEPAVRRALATSGITVGRAGAYAPSRGEL